MRTDLLAEPVAGLPEALAVVSDFDRALREGLARPNPTVTAGVQGLAGSVAGSPLAAPAADAADRVLAGAADEAGLAALAAARCALLGSAYDALAARIDEATDRERTPHEHGEAARPANPNLLAGARSWLTGLARTGWRGLDHDIVASSEQLVSALLAEPQLRRLAVLLAGFAGELDAVCPGSTADRFPERRWADLLTRAVLLTQPGFLRAEAVEEVTGRLLPLGVDLTEHPTAAQAQVHAVLEPADGSAPRLVRASVSAVKPNTVVGAGIWKLLVPLSSALAAAAGGRSVDVEQMPLTASGDLLWDEARARLGGAADPFATARVVLGEARAAGIDPLDRHPVALAEPVLLDGYRVRRDGADVAFELPGLDLAVDAARVPAAGPLTPEAVGASTACLGLLRWDATRFVLQPLAVEATVKKKRVAVHAAGWAAGSSDKVGAKQDKEAETALATLHERAGKLLRA